MCSSGSMATSGRRWARGVPGTARKRGSPRRLPGLYPAAARISAAADMEVAQVKWVRPISSSSASRDARCVAFSTAPYPPHTSTPAAPRPDAGRVRSLQLHVGFPSEYKSLEAAAAASCTTAANPPLLDAENSLQCEPRAAAATQAVKFISVTRRLVPGGI